MKIRQKHPDIDYGPLALLIGEWTGGKGMDVAPKPDGTDEIPYFETIVFEEVGDLQNAKKQRVSMIRYLQIVKRKSNGEVFHDQTGYWMWDAEAKTVMHSLTIPRGFALLAGGKLVGDYDPEQRAEMKVSSRDGDPDWGIAQSPFLRDNAKTVSFEMSVVVTEETLSYSETTNLKIYGRDFEHTDKNELTRVAKP